MPYATVRRRIARVLYDRPELWREGRLVEQSMAVGLPEAIWVFIHAYAKATNQRPGEVISQFTQEYIGMTVHNRQKLDLQKS